MSARLKAEGLREAPDSSWAPSSGGHEGASPTCSSDPLGMKTPREIISSEDCMRAIARGGGLWRELFSRHPVNALPRLDLATS